MHHLSPSTLFPIFFIKTASKRFELNFHYIFIVVIIPNLFLIQFNVQQTPSPIVKEEPIVDLPIKEKIRLKLESFGVHITFLLFLVEYFLYFLVCFAVISYSVLYWFHFIYDRVCRISRRSTGAISTIRLSMRREQRTWTLECPTWRRQTGRIMTMWCKMMSLTMIGHQNKRSFFVKLWSIEWARVNDIFCYSFQTC